MNSKPESIDVKAHKSLVRNLDYLAAGGQVYKVVVDDYGGDVHLEAVDEIPDLYFELRGEGDE